MNFVQSEAELTNSQLNCIVRHLKGEHKLPEDFSEFKSVDKIEDCESFLTESKKKIYDDEFLICYDGDSREHEAIDHKWLVMVFTALDSEEGYEQLSKLRNLARSSSDDPIKSCFRSRSFGVLFDSMVEFENEDADNMTERENREYYCLRKLVVAKELLDPSYKVVVNPENIDEKLLQTFDCQAELDGMFTALRKALMKMFSEKFDYSKNKVECVVNKFREQRYIGRFVSVILLKELNLSEQQMATERQSFINFMNEMMDIVEACNE